MMYERPKECNLVLYGSEGKEEAKPRMEDVYQLARKIADELSPEERERLMKDKSPETLEAILRGK